MATATTGVSSQADAQTNLQNWLDALAAVSAGQAYSIGDRQLTRANLSEVRLQIDYWQRQVEAFRVAALGAGNPRISVLKWTG